MQQRSLRRQHTREAYDRHDTGKTHNSDLDAPRFHKGKKMTPDERNRLRQQIDEAGQAIYHQWFILTLFCNVDDKTYVTEKPGKSGK